MPDWNYHGLCPELLRAVNEEKWLLPTSIQDESIPCILGGGDVCGAAETGSGKTAAFCLPILQLVQEELVNGGSMLIIPKKVEQETKSKPKKNKSTKSTNSAIQLSLDDRDSMLAVSQPDQLVCQSRSERQWQGVRATTGATKGAKIYFEATVEDDGLCRVGFSTAAAKYDLGTDVHSWGFGGTGKKSHSRKFITYGQPFSHGDVVGCFLDMTPTKEQQKGSVSFSLNGKMCGVAFNNIPTNAVLFPACVLKNAQMSFEFLNMKYPPPSGSGYVPIGKADSTFLRSNGSGNNNKTNNKTNNASNKTTKGGAGGVCRAIIMAPTRDLAAQIHSWIEKLSRHFIDPTIRSALIVGGGDNQTKTSQMAKAHIIVGTCGRLKDMIQRNKINTDKVRFFVLDEADQMASDKESLAIVRAIHSTLITTTVQNSARLQVCFFSATLHSEDVKRLAEEMTSHATWIDLKGKDVVRSKIEKLKF